MPGTHHKLSHQARPGLLLNLAALAWLSIVIMPCAVFAASPAVFSTDSIEQVTVDCHGSRVETQPGADNCCCDPLAVTGGEAPKTQRVDLVAITAPSPSFTSIASAVIEVRWARPPPANDDGPPVYLVTQRLRI